MARNLIAYSSLYPDQAPPGGRVFYVTHFILGWNRGGAYHAYPDCHILCRRPKAGRKRKGDWQYPIFETPAAWLEGASLSLCAVCYDRQQREWRAGSARVCVGCGALLASPPVVPTTGQAMCSACAENHG